MAAKAPDIADDDLKDGAAGEKKDRLAALKGLFKNKKVLIGAAAGIALILGGAGYFFLFSGGGSHEQEEQAAAHAAVEAGHGEGGENSPLNQIQYVDLPEMTVNLASSAGKTQFLRVRITLEVANGLVAQQIQPKMPRILDVFQVYLRELRAADIEGSAGIQRLKEELTRRVNQTVNPAQVDSVLFKEMLVQ